MKHNAKDIKIFNMYIEACNVHAEHMSHAQSVLRQIIPLNAQTLEDLTNVQVAYLDQLIYRFTKLQDTIGRKIFPIMLGLMGEDVADSSFIDKLNTLEKIGALKTKQFWQDLRETRNLISHEYPEEEEMLVETINICMIDADRLLEYWAELKQFINKRII